MDQEGEDGDVERKEMQSQQEARKEGGRGPGGLKKRSDWFGQNRAMSWIFIARENVTQTFPVAWA